MGFSVSKISLAGLGYCTLLRVGKEEIAPFAALPQALKCLGQALIMPLFKELP